jgi:hypothetical protein
MSSLSEASRSEPPFNQRGQHQHRIGSSMRCRCYPTASDAVVAARAHRLPD